ncbi:MAG: CRISPR-associated protein Cas4 [Candidatus Heimdallarchaeota archaeon]
MKVSFKEPLFYAEEVRQHVYCPRITYFRRVLGFRPSMTPKMRQGVKVHTNFKASSQTMLTTTSASSALRCELSKSDFKTNSQATLVTTPEVEIYRDLRLEHASLGLAAVLDVIEVCYDELIYSPHPLDQRLGCHYKTAEKAPCQVVEVKTGKIGNTVAAHHKAQLVCQAILAEHKLGLNVTRGIVRNPLAREEIAVRIWPGDQTWIMGVVAAMRNIVAKEWIPRPTPHAGKCTDCEYWKRCQRA